jgi:nitrite reductase/ring-hydroxylating ferredoxin subunit
MIINRRVVLTSSLVTTSSLALAACAQPPASETTPQIDYDDEPGAALYSEVLVGNIDEIPVGTGVKVKVNDELTILVTHPTEAKFRAFSATCTHAGCLVSGVKDGQIACGCHGARFNMESGEPEEGPAKSALKKLDLEVRGKELWARFSS